MREITRQSVDGRTHALPRKGNRQETLRKRYQEETGESRSKLHPGDAPYSLPDAALHYAGLGYRVVPLHDVRADLCSCGEPVHGSDEELLHPNAGKHPRTRNGTSDGTTDPLQIRRWWKKWPRANIGLCTDGVHSVVLDVDPRNGGEASLRKLEEKHGHLPPTPTVKTGGDGFHFYFQHAGLAIHSTKDLGAGLDLIGLGNLVVAPPSRHYTGKHYRWKEECATEPAALPDWIVEIAGPKSRPPKHSAPPNMCPKGPHPVSADEHHVRLDHFLRGVPEGKRDAAVFQYASSLRSRGLSKDEAKALMSEAWSGLDPGSHPFTLDEALTKVDQVWERYPSKGPEGGKSTIVSRLIEIAMRSGELFHHGDDVFASIEAEGHRETHELQAEGMKLWLRSEYWKAFGQNASARSITEAIETLSGIARFDGPERAVYLRVANLNGAIYLDIGDPEWRAIKITRDGWRIVKKPTVRFQRPGMYKSLPVPVHGGRLEELRPFVNVEDEDFLLVLAFQVGSVRTGFPFPIFAPHGEQGSAKSTLCRVMKALMDPGQVRRPPKTTEDLMVATRNSYLLVFDNLSGVREALSDDLSAIATGAGFGTRRFYSNYEEALFEAQRPIIINGIEELGSRGDLLDRIIPITLPPISETARETESDFWERFNAAAPRILGALCNAVAIALDRIDDIVLDSHIRMADFCEWSVAAAPGLGYSDEEVLKALLRSKTRTTDLALESSSIYIPLVGLLSGKRQKFEGNASELLRALENELGDVKPRTGWPTSPRAVGDQLRRLVPDLRRKGIVAVFTKNGRKWRITRRVEPKEGG
jgi:hypothetical protein